MIISVRDGIAESSLDRRVSVTWSDHQLAAANVDSPAVSRCDVICLLLINHSAASCRYSGHLVALFPCNYISTL